LKSEQLQTLNDRRAGLIPAAAVRPKPKNS